MSSHNDTGSGSSPGDDQDLDSFVEDLLGDMQSRFDKLSDTIVNRIDEMGSKIDELENSINALAEETSTSNINQTTTQNSAVRVSTGNIGK
mmetsp:Transcript_21765/g.49277  ORF Transcript_21765/g.49277 Transcript_21765/m.49277 type:complete len:91 (+) Transcript_21765:169-441(+)